LGDLAFDTGSWRELRECADRRGTKLLAQTHGLIDLLGDRGGFEIDIRECGEERVGGEAARIGRIYAACARVDGCHGKAAQRLDQQVLERGDVFLLTADAHRGAGDTLGSLFTLVTKHGSPSR